jgi:hypothetical protein
MTYQLDQALKKTAPNPIQSSFSAQCNVLQRVRQWHAMPANPILLVLSGAGHDWCSVSAGIAEHDKAAKRPAPLPTLRLFRLYRHHKILGDIWKDYRMIDDQICGPGRRSIRPNDIALMWLVLQALADVAPEKYH